MKPIKGSKTVVEYTCPSCQKKSSYESDIKACIKDHENKSLIVECKASGSQAYFKNEEQANKFVKMKENQINAIYFIPMSLSDDYTAKLEWVGPGTYNYHTNLTSEGLEYNSYEILFKRIRS